MTGTVKEDVGFVQDGSDAVSSADGGSMIIPYKDRYWWKEAIVYQIYPASFCDSNGDGWGDLNGITSKVPYLSSLGVNCIWLCPIYKSPQHDMGYDISDYRDIYEPYGTLADWDRLIKEVHKHGMKLIMDLVVNHCSSEHAWFKESRSSKTNPKRDWFYWRQGKVDADGNKIPPNNWRSVFGHGSAWTYDELTDEWYLRLFVSQQPDLNWENPEVREAVYDLMRFWLDKGVDGFRMDVINLISKYPGLPDAPIIEPGEPYQPGFTFVANGPRIHEFLREMNEKTLSKYDILTVGETPCTHDPAILREYIRKDELQMCFTFEMHDIDGTPAGPMIPKKFKLSDWKKVIQKWQHGMYEDNGWNSIYFENHDQARSITRFASDAPQFRERSGKLLALLQCSLGGTIYIYQGQDIGMINMPKGWGFEEYKDVASVQWVQGETAKRIKETGNPNPDMSDLLPYLQAKARDNARTPMQWDTSAHAGFTDESVTPWMRVHDDYKEWNVEVEQKNPDSINNFWRKLFKLRNDHLALVYGDFKVIDMDNEQVFAITREHEGQTILVVLNFSGVDQTFQLPSSVPITKGSPLLIATLGSSVKASDKLVFRNGDTAAPAMQLEAYEGVAFSL